MKKHLAPYLLGLLAVVSCGTSAQFAAGSQQFEDGIYADPRSEAPVAAVSQEEMDALVKESIESEVYVLSASGDTVVVPRARLRNSVSTATRRTSPSWIISAGITPGLTAPGTCTAITVPGTTLPGPIGILGTGIPGIIVPGATTATTAPGAGVGMIPGTILPGITIPGTGVRPTMDGTATAMPAGMATILATITITTADITA